MNWKSQTTVTKKHKYVKELVERYQDLVENRDLKFSLQYRENGKIVYVLDVKDLKNDIIYDFKFGYSNMTVEQLNQTQQMIDYKEAFSASRTEIIKISPKAK